MNVNIGRDLKNDRPMMQKYQIIYVMIYYLLKIYYFMNMAFYTYDGGNIICPEYTGFHMCRRKHLFWNTKIYLEPLFFGKNKVKVAIFPIFITTRYLCTSPIHIFILSHYLLSVRFLLGFILHFYCYDYYLYCCWCRCDGRLAG